MRWFKSWEALFPIHEEGLRGTGCWPKCGAWQVLVLVLALGLGMELEMGEREMERERERGRG